MWDLPARIQQRRSSRSPIHRKISEVTFDDLGWLLTKWIIILRSFLFGGVVDCIVEVPESSLDRLAFQLSIKNR